MSDKVSGRNASAQSREAAHEKSPDFTGDLWESRRQESNPQPAVYKSPRQPRRPVSRRIASCRFIPKFGMNRDSPSRCRCYPIMLRCPLCHPIGGMKWGMEKAALGWSGMTILGCCLQIDGCSHPSLSSFLVREEKWMGNIGLEPVTSRMCSIGWFVPDSFGPFLSAIPSPRWSRMSHLSCVSPLDCTRDYTRFRPKNRAVTAHERSRLVGAPCGRLSCVESGQLASLIS